MTSGSVSGMKRLLKRNNQKEQDSKMQIREKEGGFWS